MALGNEIVFENDPEDQEEEEEEEEDEEDLIDPVDELRDDCKASSEAQKYESKLESCNDRVTSRSKTDETCHEEMINYVQAVDHCVAKSLFSKLA